MMGLALDDHAVLRSRDEFDLTIFLRQAIIPHEEVYCDIVDPSIIVRVVNTVGLLEDEESQRKQLNLLRKKGVDVSRYTRCTGTQPCNLVADKLTEFDTQSKIVIQLQAGQPKIYETDGDEHRFTKEITITSGESSHTMYVVITGER